MVFLIILLVIVIFGLLVFVHELGHFVAAKRNGVKVEEFGFGFPPKLWGKKVGATVYSINWLPLGGFVKLKGESLVDSEPGTFGAASFWSKTKILFAGVVMNAITAYLILVGLCLTGLPPVLAGQYSHGTPSYSQPKQVMAVVIEPSSPAAEAGIKRGDILLSGNGQPLTTEDDLLSFTKTHAGQTVTMKVSHGGQERNVMPKLRDHVNAGFLGVTPFQTYKLQYNVTDSVITAAGITGQLMYATLSAFVGMVTGLFVHHQVSGDVAGPVGIVVLLRSMVDLGASYVFIFIASISLSLAVINALPLPALDGGRWAMALVQRLTRKNLSQGVENAVHAAGFALLILLMLVVTYFDIKRLGG